MSSVTPARPFVEGQMGQQALRLGVWAETMLVFGLHGRGEGGRARDGKCKSCGTEGAARRVRARPKAAKA